MANVPQRRMQYAETPPLNRRSAGEGAIAGEQAFLGESQREAVDLMRLTLAERHVFAALTGEPGLGKTTVLATAIVAQPGAAQPGPPCRIIKVDRADQVSAEQAAGIERLVLRQSASAGRQHTVIIIDDAHAAPPCLLWCLTRVAEHCRLNPGSAQVILVGRPDLWARLKAREFAPLLERIAVRPVLQPMTDDDVRGLIRHLLEQPRRILGQALTGDAEREALRLAEGRPERIGAIMRSTLTLGDVQARPPISIEMISDVAAMLDGRQPGRGGKRRARVAKPALTAAAVAAMVLGVVTAAPDWPLNHLTTAALDLAHDALPWRRPPIGGAAPTLAEASRPSPVSRPPAEDPPVSVADAQPMEAVPAAPPRAEQDEADRIAAETQPLIQSPPPAPALSELEHQAAAVTAEPPASAGQPLGADRASDTAEPSEPAAAIAPPQASPRAGVAGPDTVANPPPMLGKAPARPDPALVAALLRRGDEELALGDISTARRFFERTIAAGSAQGARGVARTYDPAVLGRGNPAASPATASAWYEMAATLGDAEGSTRQAPRKGER